MKILRVYPTRIEIEPYELGEYVLIERMCSSDYDPVTHRRAPIGFFIDGKKLILPRGMSVDYLSKITGAIPTYYNNTTKVARMKYQYKMLTEPRDETQEKAINFLLSRNEFQNGIRYSQLALNLDTGIGKTFCAISAAIQSGQRTIIITHREVIKTHWMQSICEKTNIDPDRVLDISGKEKLEKLMEADVDVDIILIMHQTLFSYARSHGHEGITELFEHLQCGIKIVDEAHLCFKQNLYIDFFVNVPRNYYLTATFTRSDVKEVRLYNLVFSNALRFGADLRKEKNIIYKFVFFNSNPTLVEQAGIKTGYGVSSYRYADYSFKRDENKTLLCTFYEIMKEAIQHEGKILIVVPKIENCDYIVKFLRNEYPEYEIGSIHSKNTAKNNKMVKDCADIIVSTIGSLGTGTDIKKIRTLICMEPYSSEVTARQLSGRLRPYGDGLDSYVYDIVDVGFPPLLRQIKKRYKVIADLSKKIETIRV